MRGAGRAVLGAVVVLGIAGPRTSSSAPSGEDLRTVASFAETSDPSRRSAALFTEAGRVILSPRCLNCHPTTDRPRQGDSSQPHDPHVRRGAEGRGVPALRCTTCHTTANYDAVGVPGAPNWHLAPQSMAWEGRSLREICEEIKDPARNGGRKLPEVVEHMRSDPLVGWAWAPGVGRRPAPGSQAAFARLLEAWAASGAVCPGP